MTQNRLKELLTYSIKDGIFKWKKGRQGTNKELIAGGIVKKGRYIVICIDGKRYQAHRLAWLYIFGKNPSYQIDHINHNKRDNRISNLREVTHQENHRNLGISADNTSGNVGVTWHRLGNKWMANIVINRKQIYLGLFINKKDAVKARKDAEEKYGFHKNHGMSA